MLLAGPMPAATMPPATKAIVTISPLTYRPILSFVEPNAQEVIYNERITPPNWLKLGTDSFCHFEKLWPLLSVSCRLFDENTRGGVGGRPILPRSIPGLSMWQAGGQTFRSDINAVLSVRLQPLRKCFSAVTRPRLPVETLPRIRSGRKRLRASPDTAGGTPRPGRTTRLV